MDCCGICLMKEVLGEGSRKPRVRRTGDIGAEGERKLVTGI